MNRKIILFVTFFMLLFMPTMVKAASPYELSFQLVKCDPNAEGMTAAKCRNNYLNGSLDSMKVLDGGDLEPGTTVMAAVHLKLGAPRTMVALQTFFTYDTNAFIPVMNTAGDNILNSNNKSNFPKYYDEDNDEYLSGWTIEANKDGDVIKLIATDLNYFIPLEKDLDIAYFFFKVSENATPGSSVGFAFDMDPASTNGNDASSGALQMTGINANYNIYGSQSRDASLKTLTVTNGSTTYPLTPNFTPGDSTNTIYRTVVPNNISLINLAATVNNEFATILAAGLGEKNLQVGDNVFNIVVTSQFGNIETYQIHVYRLSNDASLASMSLTNNISIGSIQSGVYEYSANIPFATKSTTITAVPTHTNAFVDSGLGEWTFANSGVTANTKQVIVKAENCQTEYASVQGNSCTTQPYTLRINREAPSTNNYLDSLTVNGVSVPDFNKTKEIYTIDAVSNATTSILIGATVEDSPKSTIVSGLGNKTITIGNNTLDVVVRAEDGTERTYQINVRRLSNNTKLSALNVTSTPQGTLSPAFSKTFTGDYTYTYDPTVTSINVEAIVEDTNNAMVAITDISTSTDISAGALNTASESFGVETTKVAVTVTAEDGTVQTYPINFSRLKSPNNYLSSLTISEGTLSPDFVPTIRTYSASVPGNVTSVDVTAVPEVSYAKVISITGNTNLKFGLNTVEIVVEAENGTRASYIINLTREESTIATLDSLTVDGVLVPGFSKEKTEYTLADVPYSKMNIDIGAIVSDSYASVTGTGIKGLKTGLNTFKVVVTAQNKNQKTYTINIAREKNNVADLSLLSVNGYIITPNFNKDITEYEVVVAATKDKLLKSDVTAKAADSNATVTKQEDLTLSTTVDNYYEVVVTAEDGVTKKTYTIKVVREQSSDATLKAVNVSGATISPAFQPTKYEYVLAVPAGKTDFSIEGIPNASSTQVFGNGNYTIASSVVELTTQAEDGTILIYKFDVIEALNSDATLSDLSVDAHTISPTFKDTTLNYSIGNVTYGTKELKINAIATNKNAKLEYFVDGVKQTSNIVSLPQLLGTKDISIKVTAGDGVTSKFYHINYNMVNATNAYLSNITASEGTLEFLKTKTYYELTVDNSVKSIDFDITTEDSNATITVDGNVYFTPKVITVANLIEGDTSLEVLVTAQDGSTKKTYNILIHRLAKAASTDANLSSLSVTNYPFNKEFDMATTEYSIGTIPFGLAELEINATPNEGKSTISYFVNGVKQDSNVVSVPKVNGTGAITVQVVAEDGKTTKNYKINYQKAASSNAYLNNILVSSGNLEFNKNQFTYIVNVDKSVASINITAITEDNTAVLKIDGVTYTSPHTVTLSPLQAGDSEVTILVTAEDGTVLTYKVTIRKEEDPQSTITSKDYGHTILKEYIKTVKLGTTSLEIKDQLDNANEYLEVWTADESSMVGDSEKLATGMIVKLIIDGEEKDRKYVVIKGDTSGDGEIDLFDAVKILNHYLVHTPLVNAYQEAAYVNDDTDIDLFDSVLILNHYLGKIALH